MPTYIAQGFEPRAPVAKVTLRTRDGQKSIGDVAMLIDSAADGSLLPESSVRRLGLEILSDEEFQLTAFDGKESDAKFMHCDLLFLRRAFRGRFLVMENAIGILGRDVLNHFSLVLYGPHLNWREEHTAGNSEA